MDHIVSQLSCTKTTMIENQNTQTHKQVLVLVSRQCRDGWVPFTLSNALVSVNEQRVGFTVDVFHEGHAWLLQVGQGGSGIAQLLVQQCQSGINLSYLPLQAGHKHSKRSE